jgi:hypothetical protein
MKEAPSFLHYLGKNWEISPEEGNTFMGLGCPREKNAFYVEHLIGDFTRNLELGKVSGCSRPGKILSLAGESEHKLQDIRAIKIQVLYGKKKK